MKRVYWAAALAAVACLSHAGAGRREAAPAVLRRHGAAAGRASARSGGPPTPARRSASRSAPATANAIAGAAGQGRQGRPLDAQAAAPVQPGGPYTLTIKGKNTVTLKDVYVGEVWVASGQSNMEMSLARLRRRQGGRSPSPRTPRSACSPWTQHDRRRAADGPLTGQVGRVRPRHGRRLLRRGLLLRPRPAKGPQRAGRPHRVQLGRHRRRGVDAEGQSRSQPRSEKADSRRDQDRQASSPTPTRGRSSSTA